MAWVGLSVVALLSYVAGMLTAVAMRKADPPRAQARTTETPMYDFPIVRIDDNYINNCRTWNQRVLNIPLEQRTPEPPTTRQ